MYCGCNLTVVLTCDQYNNVKVQVIATKASLSFFDADVVGTHVWVDENEWDVCTRFTPEEAWLK